MPMIDVYAAEGTFGDPGTLAQRLAATLMRVEGVPELPMFRNNTAAFVHALPDGAMANVAGEGDYVRVQVLTNCCATRTSSCSPGAAMRLTPRMRATQSSTGSAS